MYARRLAEGFEIARGTVIVECGVRPFFADFHEASNMAIAERTGWEMRDEIVRTSNLRLQSVDPVVKATCATLADAFEAKRVGAQLEMLRSQAQSKAVYSEIENFLNEFTKDLYNFMILYGLN